MNVLALSSTQSGATRDEGSEEGRSSKQQEPRIRFVDLAAHDFNVGNRMGRLLKDHGRVSFECLWDIKTAYLDAFRTPEDRKRRPSEPLVQLFDRFFGEMKCLEAIRNLLAHRGGVVDIRFIENVRKYSALLSTLAIGQPLPVDGPMVRKYLGVVAESSVSLLNFVANWLAKRLE